MHSKLTALLLVCLLVSCAQTTVRPVDYADSERRGVRFYEPLPVLITTCESVSIGWIPDFSRGYSVEARAWLAKSDLRIHETNGMLAQLHSQQDTSPILATLGGTAQEAIEQVGKFAALGAPGDTPLAEPGIWKFEYDDRTGELIGLSRVFQGAPCGASGATGWVEPRPGKPRGAPRPSSHGE